MLLISEKGRDSEQGRGLTQSTIFMRDLLWGFNMFESEHLSFNVPANARMTPQKFCTYIDKVVFVSLIVSSRHTRISVSYISRGRTR